MSADMRLRKLLWGLSLAAPCFLPCAAAAAAGEWVSHLSPSAISHIAHRDGDLYLATSGGLVVYRPANGSIQRITNTDGLPANVLTCLVFDGAGDVYAGTEESGIALLRPSAGGFDITTLNSFFHGLADDRINALAVWGDSVVYATEAGAGLIVEGFPGPRFLRRNGLPSEQVNDLLPDGDRVWMATDSGVVFLDRFGFLTNVSDGLPSIGALSLALTDTAAWVGTSLGAAYFREADASWVAAGIDGEPVFSMYFDGTRLWAGTRGRLYWNDGSGWQRQGFFEFFTTHQLNNTVAQVRGLQPMPDGTVYMGVVEVNARRGTNLLRYDGGAVEEIRFNALPANTIRRLSFDTDGSLWFATSNFGVGKLHPGGQWLNYNLAAGDTNLSSRFQNLTLLADSKGSKWFSTLWLPTQSGAALDELADQRDLDVTNDVWTHHVIGSGGGDGLGSLRGTLAKEDPAGNRWFMSDEDPQAPGWWGINILSEDRSGWKQVNPASTSSQMAAGNVSDVAFGPDGVVYVAFRNWGVQAWFTDGYDEASLFDLDGDSWATIGTVGDDFASEASINAVELRGDGVLWVGTTSGVYKYDRGQFRHIIANRGFGVGLLGNDVRDILLDRDENLWVATNLGLNRISRDDDNDIASFTTATAWQRELSLYFPPSAVSGIADARCEVLAVHPTKDLLYVGTFVGLSVLDVSSLETQATDLSEVFVYPNPVRAAGGHQSLKIANVNSPVEVRIYTLEGELVHSVPGVAGADQVVWDLTTPGGFIAASGVYIVRISDGASTVVKMISLIR